MIFITEMDCIYCAVRTEPSGIIHVTQTDEVTGDGKRLHNEQHYNVYCSPIFIRVSKSRREKRTGHVARIVVRKAQTVLVGRLEGKRPFGRPRRKWEHSIKMDLQEMGCAGVDWIDLADDRDMWRALVNALMRHFICENMLLHQ
jgi:hypothetical protein